MTRRYDNETDDDLAPWREAIARAWCEDENASKVMDPELAEAAAISAMRLHRAEMHRVEVGSLRDLVWDLLERAERAEAEVERLREALGQMTTWDMYAELEVKAEAEIERLRAQHREQLAVLARYLLADFCGCPMVGETECFLPSGHEGDCEPEPNWLSELRDGGDDG